MDRLAREVAELEDEGVTPLAVADLVEGIDLIADAEGEEKGRGTGGRGGGEEGGEGGQGDRLGAEEGEGQGVGTVGNRGVEAVERLGPVLQLMGRSVIHVMGGR